MYLLSIGNTNEDFIVYTHFNAKFQKNFILYPRAVVYNHTGCVWVCVGMSPIVRLWDLGL